MVRWHFHDLLQLSGETGKTCVMSHEQLLDLRFRAYKLLISEVVTSETIELHSQLLQTGSHFAGSASQDESEDRNSRPPDLD